MTTAEDTLRLLVLEIGRLLNRDPDAEWLRIGEVDEPTPDDAASPSPALVAG